MRSFYIYVNPVHRGKTPWKEWQKSSDNEVNKSCLYFILMITCHEIQQHKQVQHRVLVPFNLGLKARNKKKKKTNNINISQLDKSSNGHHTNVPWIPLPVSHRQHYWQVDTARVHSFNFAFCLFYVSFTSRKCPQRLKVC